ncbi:MAG: class II aldolase/adducin family protein [Rectinema sp.]|nr:class II aldolase/adducin family protein [Rectinema sp.]
MKNKQDHVALNLIPLIEISRMYGDDPNFVLAGGGNTSLKEGDVLAVKASGVSLGSIDENGFVLLSMSKLLALFSESLPTALDAREEHALKKIYEARIQGQSRRPSVETLLHALFPYRFVVHLHPALVNGLMCSSKAFEIAEQMFGQKAMILPYITPGYTLAHTVYQAIEQKTAQGEEVPHILLLQNHGSFVAANTKEDIIRQYEWIIDTIKKMVEPLPQMISQDKSKNTHVTLLPDENSSCRGHIDASLIKHVIEEAAQKLGLSFFIESNAVLSNFLGSEEAFAPLSLPFTPDHIVYSGSRPLFLTSSEGRSIDAFYCKINEFLTSYGELPKIVAIQDFGIVGLGVDATAAHLACELFSDSAKIAWYARSFGGAHPMRLKDIEFIRTWEAEKYRASVSTRSSS